MSFVHIHNHTEYSLLDGANRIPDMVKQTKDLGMDALAITDHGVMFGVMEFYFECVKHGVKPLIGFEAYVAPNGIKSRGKREHEAYHQLLLAKNLEGYRNLCKLATHAALEGYYYEPRIDHNLLRQYSAGLVGTTTCLGSEVCQALMKGEYDRAQYIAGMYAEIFGEGNYFVELQDHNLEPQHRIKDGLLQIAKELKLPLIATNDAHYLCKTDAKPHDVLLCIQTGKLVEDTNRLKFGTEEFYIKSPDEMASIFADTPEALENSLRIAEMCSVELGKQRANMPDPDLPEGETPKSYLRKIATENLPKRIKNADENALARLEYELGVIEATGFESYFLLVREFADFTRDKGIFFGVRGSAAGSLVSYCLGITDVDPLHYDLTFERFLNPERVSMPDIDLDFEDARRDEVIQYVNEKYGKDHVAQIVTFGTLGAKAAIKDCGRVLGWSPQETDKICKTIPNVPGITIDSAMQDVAEFRQIVNSDPKIKDLVNQARNVEGIARHCGVHAAGVVISREPLVEHIPLYKGNEGQPITAFEMGILEKIGLLKMDFLGLSNLTVLGRTVANIQRTREKEIDVRNLPLDDQPTYALLGRGETVGIFQLESGGMTRYVMDLKPQSIQELAAMVALYRPGPIKHIPAYIDYKFGRAKPHFPDERMVPILEETYGVIVYQDQVLKLVQALAGFSLGKADILRRAMGKKDADAMASMKAEFKAGCAEREISGKIADQIWTDLEPFAGYAFNKAHAVCYALLAYQTAYLKANYPVEYMAGLMAVYQSKEDRVTTCIEECRRMKIPVLPPDVNRSELDFSIEGEKEDKRAIRFGLAAIKGVGSGLMQAIIDDRNSNGPYQHLYEFCERAKPYGLSRSQLEALIKAGALDSIDRNRAKLHQVLEGAMAFADQSLRDRLAGQDSLFLGDDSSVGAVAYPVLPDVPPLSRNDALAQEKEVMGVYLSDHPLRGYERAVRLASSHLCSTVEELEDRTAITLAGVITALRPRVNQKTGKKTYYLTLEDFSGQAQIVVYEKKMDELSQILVRDRLTKIQGTVSHWERNGGDRVVEVRLDQAEALPEIKHSGISDESPNPIYLITLAKATSQQLRDLRSVFEQHPGEHEVQLQVLPLDSHAPLFLPYFVKPSSELGHQLGAIVPGAKFAIIEPKFQNFVEPDTMPTLVSAG